MLNSRRNHRNQLAGVRQTVYPSTNHLVARFPCFRTEQSLRDHRRNPGSLTQRGTRICACTTLPDLRHPQQCNDRNFHCDLHFYDISVVCISRLSEGLRVSALGEWFDWLPRRQIDFDPRAEGRLNFIIEAEYN